MPLNPWLVENIEAFSFYCCPECVFRSKEETFFQAHALQNHKESKSFFECPTDETGFLDIENDVKEEILETEPDIDLNLELKDDPDLDELDIKPDINDHGSSNVITNIKKEIYFGLDEAKSVRKKKKKMGVKVEKTEIQENGDSDEPFWTEGAFAKMSENSLTNYKRYWHNFCNISCHNSDSQAPTEEIYAHYIRIEKEAGRTDKALWVIYLALKKVAFHLYGQKLQTFAKVKSLLTYADKERRQGKKKDDPGVCPHCGEVSNTNYIPNYISENNLGIYNLAISIFDIEMIVKSSANFTIVNVTSAVVKRDSGAPPEFWDTENRTERETDQLLQFPQSKDHT